MLLSNINNFQTHLIFLNYDQNGCTLLKNFTLESILKSIDIILNGGKDLDSLSRSILLKTFKTICDKGVTRTDLGLIGHSQAEKYNSLTNPPALFVQRAVISFMQTREKVEQMLEKNDFTNFCRAIKKISIQESTSEQPDWVCIEEKKTDFTLKKVIENKDTQQKRLNIPALPAQTISQDIESTDCVTMAVVYS